MPWGGDEEGGGEEQKHSCQYISRHLLSRSEATDLKQRIQWGQRSLGVSDRKRERERDSLRSWIKEMSVVNVTCGSLSVFQSCRPIWSPLLSSERHCLLIEAARGENRWRDQWRKADQCFHSSDHPERKTMCLMSGLYARWAWMMISTQPICLLMSCYFPVQPGEV